METAPLPGYGEEVEVPLPEDVSLSVVSDPPEVESEVNSDLDIQVGWSVQQLLILFKKLRYRHQLVFKLGPISKIKLFQGPVADSEEEAPPTPSQSNKKPGDTGPWPGYPFNPAQWRSVLSFLILPIEFFCNLKAKNSLFSSSVV